MRPLFSLLGVALLLLLLALAAGIQRLSVGPGALEGTRTVQGLSGPVEIDRDSLGIPQVWAGSVEDALFAEGFLHGRDRLWQMEMFRRVIEGRLSELFGRRTLETDRFLRTLGLGRAARRQANSLDPGTRRMTEAYAAGVVAAIRTWSGPPPPEFLLLGTRPERWSVPLAMGIEKLMAWDLTAYDRSLALAEARRRLGPEKYAWIAPSCPDWGPVIVDGRGGEARGGVAGAFGGGGDSILNRIPEGLLASARSPAAARAFLDLGSISRASNSWVVAGARSRTGKPLLANDMHLSLDAPNIWYLVGLHAPGLDVVGMSIPGAPGVVAGRTRGVAWGFTNAYVDDEDFFVERLDPEDSTRYLTPGGSAPLETRREVIRVKDEAPDTLVVRSTRHGPVMTPVEDRAGDELLAFRWVAHDPSATPAALLRMDRADDVDELVSALSGFTDPQQNVVFADTAGRIGYWLAGRIPLRADGHPPILPVPGWTGEHDWIGNLPFEDHPHILDPAAGFVVAANNRQTREGVADRISGGIWGDPYRASRIEDLLEADATQDPASMARIQLDVRSAFAARYDSVAVAAFRRAGLDSVATALSAWDRRAGLESREATLFYAWIEELRSGLRLRLYGDSSGYVPIQTVSRFLDGRIPDPEDLPAAAARRALRAAGEMEWGQAHRLVLDHPLRNVPVVGRLFGFGRGPVPRVGSRYTVNAADFGGGPPPWLSGSGPSERHVSDLADPEGAGGFVLPGGESGFPRSPHAWDQLARWRRGRLWRLPLEREAVEARTVTHLTLRPPISRP